MKTGSFYLVIVFLAAGLTSCCSRSKTYISDSYKQAGGQRMAETKLIDAADSISRSLSELAEIEHVSNPPPKMRSPVDPNMVGMAQLASIDWSGPIEPLVRKIAKSSKYKVNILGTPPGIPILVSISTKDTPLADVLRNADFQCGRKANIVVYPASNIIELRYVKS